jgi:hypothetical protein
MAKQRLNLLIARFSSRRIISARNGTVTVTGELLTRHTVPASNGSAWVKPSGSAQAATVTGAVTDGPSPSQRLQQIDADTSRSFNNY